MEETMVKRGNRLIVYVPRELDHHFAEQITEELDSELEKGTVRQLVFDFSATTFMDSSGIGMLMGRKRLLSSSCGGTVSAIHVSDRIWRIMQLFWNLQTHGNQSGSGVEPQNAIGGEKNDAYK